jgi:hypothetical protein
MSQPECYNCGPSAPRDDDPKVLCGRCQRHYRFNRDGLLEPLTEPAPLHPRGTLEELPQSVNHRPSDTPPHGGSVTLRDVRNASTARLGRLGFHQNDGHLDAVGGCKPGSHVRPNGLDRPCACGALPGLPPAALDARRLRPGDQPLPTPNAHPSMHDLLLESIEARKALGLERYGTLLQPFNGRSFLKDAYEELVDLLVYLRGKLYEEEQAQMRPVPGTHDTWHYTDHQGVLWELKASGDEHMPVYIRALIRP